MKNESRRLGMGVRPTTLGDVHRRYHVVESGQGRRSNAGVLRALFSQRVENASNGAPKTSPGKCIDSPLEKPKPIALAIELAGGRLRRARIGAAAWPRRGNILLVYQSAPLNSRLCRKASAILAALGMQSCLKCRWCCAASLRILRGIEKVKLHAASDAHAQ